MVSDLVTGVSTTIAGRVVGGMVRDETGAVHVVGLDAVDGDIVGIGGHLDPITGASFVAVHTALLVRPTGRACRTPTLEAVLARAELVAGFRAWFQAEGFIEVETPALVDAPGTDVHLEPFFTRFSGMGEHRPQDLYLHTSPEFAMKRLLVAGAERIVQIGKVWRNGEWTARHHPEFTMAEWYRAYADWTAVMADVEQLVSATLGLELPFERVTVAEAFRAHAGVDVFAPAGPDWEDRFHELLVTQVEPRLEGAVFLTHYPRQLAVLSRVSDDDPRVAERFELYVDGVELCNGFTELNDPVEQRLRFEQDAAERARRGLPALPIPEAFLADLAAGMPPSGGVALGLDRLLMLQLGVTDLDVVLMR